MKFLKELNADYQNDSIGKFACCMGIIVIGCTTLLIPTAIVLLILS